MIKQMILLTPAIFLVHDAEEILTIESWLQANLPEMERWIGRFTWQQKMLNSHKVNTLQFSIAVLIIFTILLAVTLPVARKPQKGRQADLFLICFAMLYLHAFVHIGQAVMLRRYTPGVLTAVLVRIIPFITIPPGSEWTISESIITAIERPTWFSAKAASLTNDAVLETNDIRWCIISNMLRTADSPSPFWWRRYLASTSLNIIRSIITPMPPHIMSAASSGIFVPVIYMAASAAMVQ